MLVQRYAPDKRWYIDSLGQVLVQAGAYVKEEVVRAFVVSVSNAPDLQGYAVRLLYRALINMVEDSEEALRLAALWCLGMSTHWGWGGVRVCVLMGGLMYENVC